MTITHANAGQGDDGCEARINVITAASEIPDLEVGASPRGITAVADTNEAEEEGASSSLRSRARQGAARLLRFASALR